MDVMRVDLERYMNAPVLALSICEAYAIVDMACDYAGSTGTVLALLDNGISLTVQNSGFIITPKKGSIQHVWSQDTATDALTIHSTTKGSLDIDLEQIRLGQLIQQLITHMFQAPESARQGRTTRADRPQQRPADTLTVEFRRTL